MNDNSNKQVFKDVNITVLQQYLQQELQEMQGYNQIRYAAISKIVEKVLKQGTAIEAIELLKSLPGSQDSAAKIKQWQNIVKKVETIDKEIDPPNQEQGSQES
jgi:DNA-binding SARP family transcriptional activator